jgi:hypothetical protein
VIGYQQDYAASTELKSTSLPAYDRYKSDDPHAPLPFLPKIAGLDNSKVGVLMDKGAQLNADLERDPEHKNLVALNQWWLTQGQPNAEADQDNISASQVEGGKQALLWTALVPVAMAACYLLLVAIFAATGGYKQIHIADDEVGPTEY